MRLHEAKRKELLLNRAVRHMSSGSLEISLNQPPPRPQSALGTLQPSDPGILFYIILVLMISTTIPLTCKALNADPTITAIVCVR